MIDLTRDPVVRYTMVGMVGVSFLAFLAVVVHGYWIDPHYPVPSFIAGVLGPVLGACISLISVHQGSSTTSGGVTQGAAVATAPPPPGSNGGSNGATGTHAA